MVRNSLAVSTFLFSLMAAPAHAAPVFLDFEGSQNGALIAEFYNGGTDSFNNAGVNYGITFNAGATVRVDNGRTYLANVTSIRGTQGFLGGATFLYSTFNQLGNNPGIADQADVSARLDTDPDPSYWTNLGNTYLRRCDAYANTYCNFFGGFADVVGNEPAYLLSFGSPAWASGPRSVAVDNLTIGVTPISLGSGANIPANTFIGERATAEVPEPTSTALFGLGVIGLVCAMRRRRV